MAISSPAHTLVQEVSATTNQLAWITWFTVMKTSVHRQSTWILPFIYWFLWRLQVYLYILRADHAPSTYNSLFFTWHVICKEIHSYYLFLVCTLFFVNYINLIIIVDPAFSAFFSFFFHFFGRFVIQVMCVLFLIVLCFVYLFQLVLCQYLLHSFWISVNFNDEILQLVG